MRRSKCHPAKTRMVHLDCYATIGQVGNLNFENVSIGKAGRSRWLGIRPTVRGVVMNPIDHPHGGGEGKTSGGRTRSAPGDCRLKVIKPGTINAPSASSSAQGQVGSSMTRSVKKGPLWMSIFLKR